MAERLTTAKLNELLVKMYERRIIRDLYDDPTKPWLPEEYWRDKFLERVAELNQTKPLVAGSLESMVPEAVLHKMKRRQEDMRLEEAASVEALLEENIPSLQGNKQELIDAGWGQRRMEPWMMRKQPTDPDQVQPKYSYQCFQCGLPITEDGYQWKDHRGRTTCDLALLDQETIDAESYWTDHKPSPWRGEEEDDDDDE